jgi:hypothetical protein
MSVEVALDINSYYSKIMRLNVSKEKLCSEYKEYMKLIISLTDKFKNYKSEFLPENKIIGLEELRKEFIKKVNIENLSFEKSFKNYFKKKSIFAHSDDLFTKKEKEFLWRFLRKKIDFSIPNPLMISYNLILNIREEVLKIISEQKKQFDLIRNKVNKEIKKAIDNCISTLNNEAFFFKEFVFIRGLNRRKLLLSLSLAVGFIIFEPFILSMDALAQASGVNSKKELKRDEIIEFLKNEYKEKVKGPYIYSNKNELVIILNDSFHFLPKEKEKIIKNIYKNTGINDIGFEGWISKEKKIEPIFYKEIIGNEQFNSFGIDNFILLPFGSTLFEMYKGNYKLLTNNSFQGNEISYKEWLERIKNVNSFLKKELDNILNDFKSLGKEVSFKKITRLYKSYLLKYSTNMRSEMSVKIILEKITNDKLKFMIIVYGANHEKSLKKYFKEKQINHIFLNSGKGYFKKEYEAPPPK